MQKLIHIKSYPVMVCFKMRSTGNTRYLALCYTRLQINFIVDFVPNRKVKSYYIRIILQKHVLVFLGFNYTPESQGMTGEPCLIK